MTICHVYKQVWSASVGDVLQMGSYSNRENPHVVAVVRVDLTVGHISHTISNNFAFLFCEPALSCKLHKIYILQKLRHEKQ